MSRFCLYLFLLVCAAATSFSRSGAAQAPIRDFSVEVPLRTPLRPLTDVNLRLTLSTDGPFSFKIHSPGQPPASDVTLTVQTNVPVADHTFANGDFVAVVLGTSVVGPNRRVVKINLNLASDFDANNFCAPAITSNETWTISLTAPTNTGILGVCPLSIEAVTGNACTTGQPATSSPATVPKFSGTVPQTCALERPAVDAVLVLDKSGSMASSTQGPSGLTKIAALEQAANDFVEQWKLLRSTEPAPPNARPDRIGLVFFDTTAKWGTNIGAGLHDFATSEAALNQDLTNIPAGGATAMGEGLKLAAGVLAAGTGNPRKVVLMMSNGQQNVSPLVGVNSLTNPTEINTYPAATPNNTTRLPNQDAYQVYAVTVGTAAAVSADINQNVARARGGIYLNSETDASQLGPFFTQLLQNFLRSDCYETVRLVSGDVGGAPLKVQFPLAGTARTVTVTAQWRPLSAVLRLKLTAPNGQVFETTGRTGTLHLNLTLPVEGPQQDPSKDWVAVVERSSGGDAAPPVSVPVKVTVLSDDFAIASEFSADSDNFVPGQPIRLHAGVRDFGAAVKGISGPPAGLALVRLVRPGTTIGDLLSDNQVTGTQAPGDVSTEADARLRTLAAERPELFARANDTVQLFDDGKASHGDDKADDGIYSAVFTPSEPGHYDFLFGIEGSGRTRRFARQQLLTAHVRPIPSPTKSEFNVSTSDGQVSVQTLLRTSSGSKLGPGFGNYLWLTSPNRPPVKLQDNLNGTYSAFLGAAQDPIALHFLDTATIIQDDVPASNLPGGLDGKSVIVPDVRDAASGGGQCHGGCGHCCPAKTAQQESEGKHQVMAAGSILALGLLLRRKRRR